METGNINAVNDTRDDYHCFCCGRVLQQSAMAEATGLCDHCRETVVLERTELANSEYRVTNEYGTVLRNRLNQATDPKAKRTFRQRIANLQETLAARECEQCAQELED